MDVMKAVALSAAVAAGMLLVFGTTREVSSEPAHVEEWRMFVDENQRVYFYDARHGTLLRVHLDDEDPDFPFGYVAHVPFAFRDEQGRLVEGNFMDRLFGDYRQYGSEQ